MKLYLSSFGLGDKSLELVRLMGKNKSIGYVPNAGDYTHVDIERKKNVDKSDMTALRKLGLEVSYLDLKNYFGRIIKLKEKLNSFGGVFVRGGNTFILRQAMKLSGFDKIFQELIKREDFVYAGYSAGICVLAPDFKALQKVDRPNDYPYPQLQKTIWEGLGFLDYIILPHYRSDHPESGDIDKEVAFCKKNNIAFKTLRDGEVIIIIN